MAQMKTESEKNKLNDQRKSKELVQLKKEKRLRDNQLRMLELQNRQKDAILKVNQRYQLSGYHLCSCVIIHSICCGCLLGSS